MREVIVLLVPVLVPGCGLMFGVVSWPRDVGCESGFCCLVSLVFCVACARVVGCLGPCLLCDFWECLFLLGGCVCGTCLPYPWVVGSAPIFLLLFLWLVMWPVPGMWADASGFCCFFFLDK